LTALPARAAEEATPRPYVVLVGISTYPDKQILPRPHAEADAKALYDLFRDKKYLGADAGQVKLLLGTPDKERHSEPATRANVVKALQWAAENAGKKDTVIFGFFGEGGPVGEKACLFASDSTYKDRIKDSVTSNDVEHAL